MMITTHSDYLLNKLSNFIMLSKVAPKKRLERGYDKEDFLKPKEVSAYVFKYDEHEKGYKIEEIEVREDGISNEEFLKVQEVLYEESFRIRRLYPEHQE
ncbi:MAG: hypothetical protein ACK401_04555 [Archaeoglobaceae archaeon]